MKPHWNLHLTLCCRTGTVCKLQYLKHRVRVSLGDVRQLFEEGEHEWKTLLRTLFNLGHILVVKDPEKPDQLFPLALLDLQWLFRDVAGAFFGLPEGQSWLAERVRKGKGFVL